VQARQLYGQCRTTLRPVAAALGSYHPSLHPRATLGDYKTIHYELLFKRREEGIARSVPLRS
jgi:hypothetical protein